MAEDERKESVNDKKKGLQSYFKKELSLAVKIKIDDKFICTYQEWKQHKITAVEAMQRVGMKSNTFYRRVKEYEYSLEKASFLKRMENKMKCISILIADDEVEIADLIAIHLEKKGIML